MEVFPPEPATTWRMCDPKCDCLVGVAHDAVPILLLLLLLLPLLLLLLLYYY